MVKRFVYLLLVILILSSCTNKKEVDILSLNQESRNAISITMNNDEITKVLGKAQSTEEVTEEIEFHLYDGIKALYKNNQVIALTVDSKEI